MSSGEELLANLQVKSREEIVDQLRELMHRHRRRFLKQNLRPCPENCRFATIHRKRATGCKTCGSSNPEQCRAHAQFVPQMSKDELYQQFAADLRSIEVLRHEYRDVLALLWVLGGLDEEGVQGDLVEAVEVRQSKMKEADDAGHGSRVE